MSDFWLVFAAGMGTWATVNMVKNMVLVMITELHRKEDVLVKVMNAIGHGNDCDLCSGFMKHANESILDEKV